MENELTVVQEYNRQGLILFSQDKYDEALEYFNRAIKEDNLYIDSYINSAQVYIMRDQFDEALQSLNKAILIDKKCAPAYFHIGNVELLKNNTEVAKENYTKAISLGYDNTQIYVNLAADAQENGDFEGAISYYNKIIALDKFNAYAKASKVEILVALKRMPEALKACDSLIETNPDVFEGYHYKYAILSDLGKLVEAEAVLDRAIQLFPDDEALIYDKARLLHTQGKHAEALEVVDSKIAVTDENRSGITAFKAQLLLSLERVDEAKAILEEESSKSDDAEIAYLLTSVYMAQKDYEKAIAASQKVIDSGDIDNYYYAALYYNAVALNKSGKEAEAKAAFEKALVIFRAATAKKPGQLQLYFYRAICHKELKQYDKALDLVDFILNVDENIAEAYLVRAEIYKETGKEADALKEREKAIEINPAIKEMMEG